MNLRYTMGLITGKTNIFDKDTLIFEAGDEVEFIVFVAEGSVLKEANEDEIIHAGEFIGLKDLYNGFYSGDYTVKAGSRVLPISADSPLGLYEFLTTNPAIHMSISFELCVFITKLHDMYQTLYSDIEDFYSSIIAMHKRYLVCCEHTQIPCEEFMMPHKASNFKFDAQDFCKNYMVFQELSHSRPRANTFIKANGEKFLKIQADIINDMYTAYDDMVYYLKTIISLFASKSEHCLFSLVARLADKAPGKYKGELLQLLTDMKNVITHIDEDIRSNTGLLIDIDYNRVNFYFLIVENMDDFADIEESDLSTENASSDAAAEDNSDILADGDTNSTDNVTESPIDVTNTLHTLCNFAGFDEPAYYYYEGLVGKFKQLSDYTSKDDTVRHFRKEFTEAFFKLYEGVFVNYAKATDRSDLKLVELFLDFGFMDEGLLTDSQIEAIISIGNITPSKPCAVYRMKDWLLRVYDGIEPTSKNEFDMDYADSIRERKKTEAITSAKEKELLNNNELKVRFEIQNLLKYNLRLVNGNVLSCFPMLHMHAFDKDIKNMVLTAEAVNNTVNALNSIDYSIFYREILYSDIENKIQKANIQKEVFPVFILFPTVGTNGIMWQETSGKRVNSAGRFLLPALFSGKLEDVMVTLFGRFRFELCKTLYGSSWNNIQVPSLTSEYCDYIQFYRKNKELSAEKKEALKNQITRCRNNMREIFVYDYIIYIRYEAAGAIRLNKVARRILATYCPYNKDIRSKISSQPIFEEAMMKYQRNKLKKIKEINNQIAALKRAGATITEEIENTRRFYEEF